MKKQLEAAKDNEFTDNKLYYYLKPTDLHYLRVDLVVNQNTQARAAYTSCCFI